MKILSSLNNYRHRALTGTRSKRSDVVPTASPVHDEERLPSTRAHADELESRDSFFNELSYGKKIKSLFDDDDEDLIPNSARSDGFPTANLEHDISPSQIDMYGSSNDISKLISFNMDVCTS